MIVGGQTKARAQLSSTIIDYHEPFDQGLFGHFEKYGFKVFLRSLRAQIRDLQIGLRVRDRVRVRVSNFKPVTFLGSLLYMLVFR